MTNYPRWFWWLLRHPRVHKIVHRTGNEACFVCRYVWQRMEAVPGFNERLRAAEAELEAGGGVVFRVKPHTHFYKWSDVKAEKQGGPPPKCSGCGEQASR